MADELLTGGCYCRAVRYEFSGPLNFRGLCLCRTCQMISGGAGNYFAAAGADTFRFTTGSPRSYTDEEHPWRPMRHFCETCGVHLTARSARAPTAVLVKVGTLDDPGAFAGPQFVTWTSEMQKFHVLPPDVRAYPELPSAPRRKDDA
jgi:hypothetical protein